MGVVGEFLLTVGTLEPRKNVDRLVRAFARVRDSLPGPWPLVIVGPAGWGPEPPVPRAADHVVFTGPVPDVVLSELYRRARAFAYVPLTEGYGLPPLEAMRVGIPTVVSDEVPSVHDLGAVGPAPARIVDPLDVDDIAAGPGRRPDRRRSAGRTGEPGRGVRVGAHLARAPPAPTSSCGGRCGDGRAA